MVKKLALVAVCGAIASVLMASAAQAEGAATVALRQEAGTTWADATSSGGSVRVVFLTPRTKSGARAVWQSCRFPSPQAGTYSCGIDTSKGSLAERRGGSWLVKVFLGETLATKTTFTL
ncbi:MAG: hypothetical protein ACLGIB_11135 [Actinomycetota bacterium]